MVKLLVLLASALFSLACIPAICLADCEEPPLKYPLTPDGLAALLRLPRYQTSLDCCCYNNFLSEPFYIPGGSDADQCCEEYAPGYVTQITIKKRLVLPCVNEGSRNADTDFDGYLDYHEEGIAWESMECYHNGVMVRPCWVGWQLLTKAYVFDCVDCVTP